MVYNLHKKVLGLRTIKKIDKAKPVTKQGRKTTGLKKIADLPEKLVLKRQKEMQKRKIAKAKGEPMSKSGRKRKFRKSGINILGLAIFILSIIGVFTKL